MPLSLALLVYVLLLEEIIGVRNPGTLKRDYGEVRVRHRQYDWQEGKKCGV
jgi:hypothetical protein